MQNSQPAPYKRYLSVEATAFSEDMKALYRGDQAGHLGRWTYSDQADPHDPVRGAQLWKRAALAKDYYPFWNEIMLMQSSTSDIAATVGDDINTVIEFGPGSPKALQQKTVPLLKAVKSCFTYVPIDLSQEFLDQATATVQAELPQIHIMPRQADFSKATFPSPQTKNTTLGMYLGVSISNIPGFAYDPIPADAVVDQLQRLRGVLGQNGWLLISHDANQDERSIVRAYMHPTHKAHVENLMYRVRRDLLVAGDFDPAAWQYEAIWSPRTHLLSHTLVATRGMRFALGHDEFRLSKGDRFTIDNSYKFPIELFLAMAKKASLDAQKTYTDYQNRIVMHVFRGYGPIVDSPSPPMT